MFCFSAVEITINSYTKNDTKVMTAAFPVVHPCLLTFFMAVVQSHPHFMGSQTCAFPWWLYIHLGWRLWALPSVAQGGIATPLGLGTTIPQGLHTPSPVQKLEGIFWMYLFLMEGYIVSAPWDTGLLTKTISLLLLLSSTQLQGIRYRIICC